MGSVKQLTSVSKALPIWVRNHTFVVFCLEARQERKNVNEREERRKRRKGKIDCLQVPHHLPCIRLIIFFNPLRCWQFWKRMKHPILPFALMQCPRNVIPRTSCGSNCGKLGSTRWITTRSCRTRRPPEVNLMHQTGLLQQFQYVTPEDDDDKPTGLAAMDLDVEDDRY